MYRSGFEKVCDTIANMQTSLGEATQWAIAGLCIGLAGTVLAGTILST